MRIEVAAELWGELRRYVNTVDRDDAAESVVSVLIDHDFGADEICNSFKGDSDIKRALAGYLDNNDLVDDEIEDDEEDHNTDWED